MIFQRRLALVPSMIASRPTIGTEKEVRRRNGRGRAQRTRRGREGRGRNDLTRDKLAEGCFKIFTSSAPRNKKERREKERQVPREENRKETKRVRERERENSVKSLGLASGPPPPPLGTEKRYFAAASKMEKIVPCPDMTSGFEDGR